MKKLTYTLDHDSLKTAVSLDDLLKKYKRPRSRKKMQPLYEQMIAEVAARAEPRLIFEQFGADVVAQLNDHVSAETVRVVLVACTLGEPLDRFYETLNADDQMAQAAIVDEVGLLWIVNLTRQFHQSIRAQLAEQGLKAGPPFRPGVGKLPIDLQTVIFDHLPADQIGLTLNEYLVMTPIRSTTLVVPIYDRG